VLAAVPLAVLVPLRPWRLLHLGPDAALRKSPVSAATGAARNAKGAVLAPYLSGIFVELTGIEPVTS
jgi:hypothetical protein